MANLYIKIYCHIQGYGWGFIQTLDLDKSTVGIATTEGVVNYPISSVRKIALISTIPVHLCRE